MVWPLIMGALRTYAPYITFPVAAVVGFIGYNMETWARGDTTTPFRAEGVKEERIDRELIQLENTDCTQVESLKSRKDIPKTVLGRNDALRPPL